MTRQALVNSADGSGAMFDKIAKRYDLLNRLMSFGIDGRWRRRLVSALGPAGAGRVLDLATGTGDVAIEIARTHRDAQIVGIDPSIEMIEVGRSKVDRHGLADRIHFKVGAAESLPLDDDSVDACCIAFGIRNVGDRALGLREMARVTRPGGRIAILELSEPTSGLLGPLARFHVHHVIPTMGALLSGRREYRYLQRSIAAFPAPEQFASVMEQSDIEVLEVAPLTFGVSHLYVGAPLSRGAA